MIRNLRKLGFEGPRSGTRHQTMFRESDRTKVTIPNPHHGDINVNLLRGILKQAGITREQWEQLK